MSVVYVGHRLGLDPALLWLWCRPAAKALLQPPAWELPYAASVALKRPKKKKKRKESGSELLWGWGALFFPFCFGPQIHMLKYNLQCDSIKRRGFWNRIQS